MEGYTCSPMAVKLDGLVQDFLKFLIVVKVVAHIYNLLQFQSTLYGSYSHIFLLWAQLLMNPCRRKANDLCTMGVWTP